MPTPAQCFLSLAFPIFQGVGYGSSISVCSLNLSRIKSLGREAFKRWQSLMLSDPSLLQADDESLAASIQHTSVVRGGGCGVLPLNVDDSRRLNEIKTTTNGWVTRLFISRNEVLLFGRKASGYHL